MKREKEKNELHECPECGLWYREKKWAEKCHYWCEKNNSCHLEITAHAEKRKTKGEIK